MGCYLFFVVFLLFGCAYGSGQLYGFGAPNRTLVKVTASPFSTTPVGNSEGSRYGFPFVADAKNRKFYMIAEEVAYKGQSLYGISLDTGAFIHYVNLTTYLPYIPQPDWTRFNWQYANYVQVDSKTGNIFVVNSEQKTHVTSSTNVYRVNPLNGAVDLLTQIQMTNSFGNTYYANCYDQANSIFYMTLATPTGHFLYAIDSTSGKHINKFSVADEDSFGFLSYDYTTNQILRITSSSTDGYYNAANNTLNWVNPKTGSQTKMILTETQAYCFMGITFDFEGRVAYASGYHREYYYLVIFNIDSGAMVPQPYKFATNTQPSALTWVPNV